MDLFYIFNFFFSIYFHKLNFIRKGDWIVDESFHVGQSMIFAYGRYRTFLAFLSTFPGPFYLTGFFYNILGLMKNFKSFKEVRRVHYLNRLIFVFYARLLMFIFYILNAFLLSKFDSKKKLFFLIVSLIPVNFYFHFLFYTENCSLLFLTIFLYYSKYYKTKKLFIVSFIIDLLTLLMRQTNIAFINFLALEQVIELLFSLSEKENRNIKDFIKKAFNILIENLDIAVLDIFFILFVIKNGSFVIGDKGHHKAHLNLTYIHHLLLYLVILFPSLNNILINTFKVCFSKKDYKKLFQLFLCSFIFYITLLFFNRRIPRHIFNFNPRHYYRRMYYTKFFLNRKFRNKSACYLSLLYSSFIIKYTKFLLEPKFIAWLICTCLSIIPQNFVNFRYMLTGVFMLTYIVNELNNLGKYNKLYDLMINKFILVYYILLDGILGDFMIIGTYRYKHGNLVM